MKKRCVSSLSPGLLAALAALAFILSACPTDPSPGGDDTVSCTATFAAKGGSPAPANQYIVRR
jgi:predicted small secreted protein